MLTPFSMIGFPLLVLRNDRIDLSDKATDLRRRGRFSCCERAQRDFHTSAVGTNSAFAAINTNGRSDRMVGLVPTLECNQKHPNSKVNICDIIGLMQSRGARSKLSISQMVGLI
jgi:hypothetical protein